MSRAMISRSSSVSPFLLLSRIFLSLRHCLHWSCTGPALVHAFALFPRFPTKLIEFFRRQPTGASDAILDRGLSEF
jgi:hypothetical protein